MMEDPWKADVNRRIAVVRIRGRVDVNPKIRKTLDLLGLRRKNTCSIFLATPPILGMLKVVNSWITWGDIDFNTFSRLLRRRGRLSRKKRLTEDYVLEKGFKSWEDFVEFAWKNPRKNLKLLGIKPVFFLNNPSGGFERKGIKRFFSEGGALGYRGFFINDLLNRMM